MESDPRAPFPTTVMSVLLAAKDPEQRRAAHERLARLYWKPVFSFLRGFHRRSIEDAKDLTQAFFASLWESDALALFEGHSRFRTFLKAALRHFLAKTERNLQRLKRGGGQTFETLVTGAAPPAITGPDEDKAFERSWTFHIVGQAMDVLLERRRADPSSERLVRVIEARLVPGMREEPAPTIEALAKLLGVSPKTVESDLTAARGMLKMCMREIVRDTIVSPDDLDDELKKVLSS